MTEEEATLALKILKEECNIPDGITNLHQNALVKVSDAMKAMEKYTTEQIKNFNRLPNGSNLTVIKSLPNEEVKYGSGLAKKYFTANYEKKK